jgi:hypothetical protein
MTGAPFKSEAVGMKLICINCIPNFMGSPQHSAPTGQRRRSFTWLTVYSSRDVDSRTVRKSEHRSISTTSRVALPSAFPRSSDEMQALACIVRTWHLWRLRSAIIEGVLLPSAVVYCLVIMLTSLLLAAVTAEKWRHARDLVNDVCYMNGRVAADGTSSTWEGAGVLRATSLNTPLSTIECIWYAPDLLHLAKN